jgi:shikimate kinase
VNGSDRGANVVLTGFMGTGKSTVGRLLAEHLGWTFVDTDALIESRHGAISEIFASRGEAAFRELERKVARELAQGSQMVIATGGRLMLDQQNAEVLGRRSRVFCLVASPADVLRRLGDEEGPERPLLAATDRVRRIIELLAERAAGYARFEQIDTEARTPAEIVADLVERLGLAG